MKRLVPALLVTLLALASTSRTAWAQTTADTSIARDASSSIETPDIDDRSSSGDTTPCDKPTVADTSTPRYPPTTRDTPIHHDIYITLKDHSKIAVQKQLRLGKEYLGVHQHPGELSFSATVLATGLKRHKQVPYLHNETDFDVAFHLVFANARAHDKYQCSYAHVHEFIPKSKSNWQELRVFDSVKR
jgi:hypothetical protein